MSKSRWAALGLAVLGTIATQVEVFADTPPGEAAVRVDRTAGRDATG